jgi:hypothetical protein
MKMWENIFCRQKKNKTKQKNLTVPRDESELDILSKY